MEKTWLRQYPADVAAEVDVHQFGSLTAMLDAVCARFAGQPAFSNLGATLSYRELDELSRRFATWLQHEAGVAKGDRVALMMPNLLQYPVALFGVLRAGAVVVNTNPQYTARELEYQLVDSGASCLVVLENFAHTAQEVLARTSVRTVVTTQVGDLLHFPRAQVTNFVVRHVRHLVPGWRLPGATPLPAALEAGHRHALLSVPLGARDLAFLQYTGGTTGVPKGAMLTHGNVVANVLQTTEWVHGALDEGAETAVIPLPLYHVFALTVMLSFLKLGAHNILVTDPRDVAGLVRLLKGANASAIVGVNTLFNALVKAPGIAAIDTRRMKMAIAGGMALQRAVAQRWQDLFSLPIIEGYGLTECSPVVAANPVDIDRFTGMVGLPLPSTEVAIVDDAGRELPAGETGEIAVRGPQVMAGYWNKPEETANVFTPDGLLRTGDIGVMDGRGQVRLIERKKDVIIVSGFKVYPNEVEEVAMLHPGVLEAAAIGVPDAHGGEAVRLVATRRDPGLGAEALLAHLRQHLAGYKVPHQVSFRSAPLPKSNVGKVLRRVVKDEETRPVEHA